MPSTVTAPSPSSPALATVPPTETVAPTPAPSPATTAWDEAFTRDHAQIGALIVWRDGFLAAGCDVDREDSFCTRNFIVSSSGGANWTMTEMPIPTDFGIRSLHIVGDRLFGLAFGHYFAEDFAGGAIVVTSTDGRTWTRVESGSFPDRAINDIVEAPFGTFGVGYEAPIDSDDTSGFLLWPVRPDGTVGKPRTIEVNGAPPLVSGATWLGKEFLAWGGTQGPYGGPPILLASNDGVEWKGRAAIKRSPDADNADVDRFDERLVAVGNSGRYYPLTPTAWFSDDGGQTWDEATVEGEDAAMYAIGIEGGRLIARGRISYGKDSRPISWASADGETWTRLPDDADLPNVLGFSPFTRATHDGRTCVADTISWGEGSRGAIFCR
jgi:hypothetical protein